MAANPGRVLKIDSLKLRRIQGYRPYHLAVMETGREVEIISYPFRTEAGVVAVRVRLVPGDPSTVAELSCDSLNPRLSRFDALI